MTKRKNKATERPAPVVPPTVHDLGPIPRSVLIRCMMGDFGMNEEQASERVDAVLSDLDADSYLDDRDESGPVTKGTA